jgi:hypothetical protein
MVTCLFHEANRVLGLSRSLGIAYQSYQSATFLPPTVRVSVLLSLFFTSLEPETEPKFLDRKTELTETDAFGAYSNGWDEITNAYRGRKSTDVNGVTKSWASG